ncbi:MAG: hypothetical protein QCI00_02335 [Candidatus Thermoplasmatota archaeon]|nr:hypothetical protein [Candidatus Thermoplasmatota archaeon]
MGKHSDIITILLIVIIGMFFPFLGSLVIMFDVSPLTTLGLMTIGSTFGIFLLIFGIELVLVYLYFFLTNTIAQKKIDSELQRRKE